MNEAQERVTFRRVPQWSQIDWHIAKPSAAAARRLSRQTQEGSHGRAKALHGLLIPLLQRADLGGEKRVNARTRQKELGGRREVWRSSEAKDTFRQYASTARYRTQTLRRIIFPKARGNYGRVGIPRCAIGQQALHLRAPIPSRRDHADHNSWL